MFLGALLKECRLFLGPLKRRPHSENSAEASELGPWAKQEGLGLL